MRSEAISVKQLNYLEEIRSLGEEETKERRRCRGMVVEEEHKLEVD